MKKAIFFTTFILVTVSLTTSCKKDSSGAGTPVSATESIFETNIFDVPSFSGNTTKRNRGYEFKVNSPGRITHLGAKISKGTYAVTLWDSSAQSIITSINVTNTDSTVFAYADINDVTVEPGKVYVITVYNEPAGGNSQNNIWYSAITSSSNYFPKTIGTITFMAYVETNASNASQLFPYTFGRSFEYLLGFPSFRFEPAQ